MNNEISKSAICYGLYDGDNIIGIIGIIHFPHPVNKKIKKVTRLVILPDYQGIGLGTKFLEEVAKMYSDFDFMITTSAKNLIWALNKSENWAFKRYTKSKKNSSNIMLKTIRSNVKTATFQFCKK